MRLGSRWQRVPRPPDRQPPRASGKVRDRSPAAAAPPTRQHRSVAVPGHSNVRTHESPRILPTTTHAPPRCARRRAHSGAFLLCAASHLCGVRTTAPNCTGRPTRHSRYQTIAESVRPRRGVGVWPSPATATSARTKALGFCPRLPTLHPAAPGDGRTPARPARTPPKIDTATPHTHTASRARVRPRRCPHPP